MTQEKYMQCYDTTDAINGIQKILNTLAYTEKEMGYQNFNPPQNQIFTLQKGML